MVKLDGRGGKKRRDLGTACVFPAPRSRVDHGQNVRRVQWQQKSNGHMVSFDVHATLVAQPGQPVGGEAYWEACPQPQGEQVHRVRLYLHALVLYMAEGFARWQDLPLSSLPVDSQSIVVLHLGECGGCCAPWHMRLGSKRENSLRQQRFMLERGRHLDYSYQDRPEGVSSDSD